MTRLLEIIHSYSFNLCYIKCRGMILTEFLSTLNNVLLSSTQNNMHEGIYARYYNIHEKRKREIFG